MVVVWEPIIWELFTHPPANPDGYMSALFMFKHNPIQIIRSHCTISSQTLNLYLNCECLKGTMSQEMCAN
jgi:hypothetical protein